MTTPRPSRPVAPVRRRAPVSARTAIITLAVAALVAVVAGTWAAAYFTAPKTSATVRTGGPVINDAAAIAVTTTLIKSVFALPASSASDNIVQFKASTCDDYRHKNLDLLQQRLDQVRATGEPATATITAIGVTQHPDSAPAAQVLAVVESTHGESRQSYRVTYTVASEQGQTCVSGAEFEQ